MYSQEVFRLILSLRIIMYVHHDECRLTVIISIRIFLNARRKYKTYQHLRRRRIPLIVTHLLA